MKVLAAGDTTKGGSSIQSSVVFKRPEEVISVPTGPNFISSEGNSEVDHAPSLST